MAAVVALLGCGRPAVRLHEGVHPEEFLDARGFSWVADTVGTFIIHAERGGYAAGHLDDVDALVAAVPRRIQAVLGRALPDAAPVYVFVLDSNDAMHRLIGWRGNAMTLNTHPPVVLGIYRADWHSLGEHEFFHVATQRLFGPATGYGAYALNEGIAVYASGTWQGHDLHALTHYLREHGQGYGLDELLAVGKDEEHLLYPQAGSFVRFLRERYGGEKLAQLLASQYGRNESRIEEVYGLSTQALEAAWDAVVDAADTAGITY